MKVFNRTALLVLFAMLAFAANSLLCRMALKNTHMDAGSFTAIRLLSGAIALGLIARWTQAGRAREGNWGSALALFTYAAGFSYAYIRLPAATGALVLFGSVQLTMIGYGLYAGERLRAWQWFGFLLACAGLAALLAPNLQAPPLGSSALMVVAGVAWGAYSLRGKRQGNPTQATAGNFLRAAPLGLLLVVLRPDQIALDPAGVWLAMASGALASGIGYAIWYSALPHLPATTAATVQLSVPVLASIGGVAFLAEPISARLVLCSVMILSGIASVVGRPSSKQATPAAH